MKRSSSFRRGPSSSSRWPRTWPASVSSAPAPRAVGPIALGPTARGAGADDTLAGQVLGHRDELEGPRRKLELRFIDERNSRPIERHAARTLFSYLEAADEAHAYVPCPGRCGRSVS